MNILKRRYTFFALSLLVIVPGLVILAVKAANRDLPLALDFTGGSLLEVQFEAGAPQPADAVGLYDDLGIEDAIVTTTESGSLQIRSSFLDENLHQQVLAALREQFGESTVLRFDSVGPTIGKQVASRAGID
jgi:preprotein translocase subunit SecF